LQVLMLTVAAINSSNC